MAKVQKKKAEPAKRGRPPSGKPIVDRNSGAVTATAVLRIDARVMERLKAVAARNKRSIKGEAEIAIERHCELGEGAKNG